MKAARIKSEPPSTLVNLLPGTCSAAQISDQFSLAYSLALVLIRHGEGSARPGGNFLVTKRLYGGSDFSFFQGRHPRRELRMAYFAVLIPIIGRKFAVHHSRHIDRRGLEEGRTSCRERGCPNV